MRRLAALAVGAVILLGVVACGEQRQTVSRAELAGIVRPAGERPTGTAFLTVRQADGVPLTIEIDRGAYWDDTGITLPPSEP